MKDGFPGTEIPAALKGASWIWPDSFQWDNVDCFALFRTTFSLGRVPRHAPFHITADQSYRMWVNGRPVCRGPARGFQSHWPFDTVDLAPWLKRGKNLIAIRAYNPGRSTYQYITQGVAGLLAAGEWGGVIVATGKTWKRKRQAGIARGTVPSSLQLFSQEHFDARKEEPGWEKPGFDDSGWGVSGEERRWNSPPWHSLEERGIPLLAERRIYPVALVGTAASLCAPGWRDTRDVVEVRVKEPLGHGTARGNPRLLRVAATGKEGFRSYLIDFGHTVVGSLALAVKGGHGGETIDTLHVETIDQAKLVPDVHHPAGCRMAIGSRLVCRTGATDHVFHHPYGFRYLVLTVRGTTVPISVGVALDWIGYPLERKGSFTSSDRLLERIWEVSAWTQQCCSLDAYVDTPWREQAQWWGDARVQGWNMFHITGDARLLRRGIHCIASQTTPNGLTYGHAPTMAHGCVLPDFTLIWLLTMWDHYRQTGSPEAFRTHREVADRALEYFAGRIDKKTGLAGYDPRYWLFLDWTDIFKDGYPALYNLWLLLALDRTAELNRLVGRGARARELAGRAARLRVALKRLVNAQGLVADGLKWDGTPVDEASVCTQTLAIMTGLAPEREGDMLAKSLLPFIREQVKPKISPSAYWITYVFSVLAERGWGTEVVDYIRKYWAPMADHGTTFEGFNPDRGEISHSHAWAAHPVFHLMQTIGGITQDAPGWARIRFDPLFIGDRGSATVPSPRGPITGGWERGKSGIRVRLSLPRGVAARVELPGLGPVMVRGRKTWRLAEDR